MSDFKIEKVLGRGSFGSVYLVTRKQDNKIYALKTVTLEKLSKKEQENSVNEVRILASVTHPNVIGYKEAFWNDKESSLNIVMEYADDGDLQTKIQKMKKEGGMFNENLIWSYSIQMIEGLKALHDKKIMHRDLKSANIFLVKDKHQCKLGDMNVSKVIKDKVLLTQTGTPYYASPEVWNDEPYSYKSDLWSIGCVIYEICALRPPFHGKDLDELYVNVCKGKIERINHVYSDDLWKMIKMLLQVDVNKRVNCDSFLNSKLIIKKKKELKEKIKEFNYIENNLEKNKNNGVLLNTIKFNNIKEIKSQLPKNKNYNNENEDYSNYNGYDNILMKYQDLNNKFKKYKKVNHINNNMSNNITKNYPSNICIDNNNNYKYKSNRNNRRINAEKTPENITYSINRTNSGSNNDQNISNINKYILNNNIGNKNSINLKPKITQQKMMNNSKNKIIKTTSKRQFALNEYPSLKNVGQINQKNSKERFKTEQQKEEEKAVYIKIKNNKNNKPNLINSIPNSIKRTITSRQNVSKLQKESHIRFTSGNYSYLKLDESKGINKNKFSHINETNSISEIRSKTPSLYEKNIYKIPHEILTNDIYNYYKKNFRKQNLQYKKSISYLRNNLKTANSIKDENVIYNNYLNNNNVNISQNLNNNNIDKKDMIKKIIQNRKNNLISRERRPSASLSKRIFDNNQSNNRNLSLNYNYECYNKVLKRQIIPKSQIIHTSNSNYNININNNYKNFKSYRLSNKSSGNIKNRNDILNDNYSPIRKRNTFTSNKYRKNCEQIRTTMESDNNLNFNFSNISKKKYINNNNNDLNISNNKYNSEANIKKINNTRNAQQKRIFNEKNKERTKKNLIPNRDLTETELMMILNDIKGKENYRNNKKKSLNLSLNDNIAPNNFLKHIRRSKHSNTNNIKLNKFYTNNNNPNNNNNIIKTVERNKGTKIYNNFYSINNIGNSNVPVKVINVFN